MCFCETLIVRSTHLTASRSRLKLADLATAAATDRIARAPLRLGDSQLTFQPLLMLFRVWSVAHSRTRHHLCASASDDGTAALWGGPGLSCRAAPPLAPAPGWPVTCVDFCPEDDNALLVACSDGGAYVYDLRNRCGCKPPAAVLISLSCCVLHLAASVPYGLVEALKTQH